MKKPLFFIALMFLTAVFSVAQPQGFSYQTVVRNNSGNPITNQQVKFRFTIYQNSLAVYVETDTVTTNDFGLVNLIIGKGTVESGDFTAINWSGANCSLCVELDLQDGNGYHDMGTSAFTMVPYAKYAVSSAKVRAAGEDGEIQFSKNDTLSSSPLLRWNDTGRLVIRAPETVIDSLPLFEVKDKDGKTVFAVFNNGVHVYVDKEAKKRSYGAYKGGFVVSGKNSGAKANNDILIVNSDSTRIFTQDEKAGFGVVGVSAKRGSSASYMHITPINYFIGENSGKYITSGKYNSTFGFETGLHLTTASRNVFLGYQAGQKDSTGDDNVFIGNQAGFLNISSINNVVIGSNAGFSLDTAGNNNVFIGKQAGEHVTNGIANVFIGSMSGNATTTGLGNIFIGDDAGIGNTTGNNNIFMGAGTGYDNTEGQENIFLGTNSGYNNTIGIENVFIGFQAGYNNIDGKDNIMLGNQTGYSLQHGNYNVFMGTGTVYMINSTSYTVAIGINSGHFLESGSDNTFLGTNTALYLTKGSGNVFVGTDCGRAGNSADTLDNASHNTFLGNKTGYNISTGNDNVFLGYEAGYNNNGSGNIFLGNKAGLNETGSNKLYIANSDSEPLIYGDFEKQKVTINNVLILKPISSAPSDPVEGEIYVNSNDHHMYCYLNGAWKQLDN